MRETIRPSINGRYVNLRDVELSDATFILALRTNEKKAKFLSKTENNLDKQVNYLKRYKQLENEWYFIIENKKHEPLGTVRIYNIDYSTNEYTGGSWLMNDNSSATEVLESNLLLKEFAFQTLKFNKEKFDVRKKNIKVIRFHLLCGAEIVGEDESNYYFELTKERHLKRKEKLFSLL